MTRMLQCTVIWTAGLLLTAFAPVGAAAQPACLSDPAAYDALLCHNLAPGLSNSCMAYDIVVVDEDTKLGAFVSKAATSLQAWERPATETDETAITDLHYAVAGHTIDVTTLRTTCQSSQGWWWDGYEFGFASARAQIEEFALDGTLIVADVIDYEQAGFFHGAAGHIGGVNCGANKLQAGWSVTVPCVSLTYKIGGITVALNEQWVAGPGLYGGSAVHLTIPTLGGDKVHVYLGYVSVYLDGGFPCFPNDELCDRAA